MQKLDVKNKIQVNNINPFKKNSHRPQSQFEQQFSAIKQKINISI
jgi:hypothetical protein